MYLVSPREVLCFNYKAVQLLSSTRHKIASSGCEKAHVPASFGNALKADRAESTTLFKFQDLQTLSTALYQDLEVVIRDGHPFEFKL
jgi:hypothetical protein